ncbi:MAG: hypothetical protein AAGA70_04500 [Pseudomonadota bacterium]
MIRQFLLALVRLVFNAVVAGTIGALIVGFMLQRAAEVAELRQETAIALNRAAVLARDRSDPQVDLPDHVQQRFEEELDEDLFLLRGRLPDNLRVCLERLVNRTRLRDERIVDMAAWRRAFDEDSAQYAEWIKAWAQRATFLPILSNPWEDRTCGFE